MASKDSTVVLYGGQIRLEYKDKAHRYYVSELEGEGAWGKAKSTKGVTTMMDNVLEKKGLMTWPMGLALRELFGFYDFTNDGGDRLTGFSKGVGTMWRGDEIDVEWNKENALPVIQSASKAWQRRKQRGADIGSAVHQAIEMYVKGEVDGKLDVLALYMANIQAADFENDEAKQLAIDNAAEEAKAAGLAFDQFVAWWDAKKPKLLGAEAKVYSREMNFAGTFDGLIELDGKIVLTDWKTSNSSTSKEAAAPEGVYYSYFIQSAFYALAWKEMGKGVVDDLMIVSCRKDGGFSTVSASELGITVGECIDWAKAVLVCYNMATKTKRALLEHGKEAVSV